MSSPEAWMTDAEARLSDEGYQVSHRQIRGADHLVGHRREFRLRWMATSVHVFVVMHRFERVDAPTFQSYAHHTMDWAIKNKPGLPRGFQTGVAALSVAVTDTADEATRSAAAARPGKRWSAFPMPTLVETEPGRMTTYTGHPVWGLIYTSFMAEQQRIVRGDLSGQTLGS